MTFNRHIRELQLGTSQPLGFVINYTVQALSSLGLAFYYSWRLTLVVLASIPLVGLTLSLISANLPDNIRNQGEEIVKATKLASVAISNIFSVKCCNTQDQECRKYRLAVRKAAAFYFNQAQINALQIGFVRFATTSMFVQGFWYGGHLVHATESNAGNVVTTFWSCLMATKAFEDILPHVPVLEKATAAGEALKALLGKFSGSGMAGQQFENMINPQYCAGDIAMIDVSFSYPTRPDHLILRQVNLFFRAGQTTFVVGKSGSGKSSLANLLTRFYQPNQGSIYIDGMEIGDLTLSWLRNNVTLVQQQTILFNETIFRNIAFGHRNYKQVTLDDIKPCVDSADLQSTLVDLPGGVYTSVGIGGSALSGGQKQRIAVARARLRDAPILILDESTSALDYSSRNLVMSNIREWREGKTTIIITHDLSQIRRDDFVYILEEGSILSQGHWRIIAPDFRTASWGKELTMPSAYPTARVDFGWGVDVPSSKFGTDRSVSIKKSRQVPMQSSTDLRLETDLTSDHRKADVNPSRTVKFGRALSLRVSQGAGVVMGQYKNETAQIERVVEQGDSCFQEGTQLPPKQLTIPSSRPMSVHQVIAVRSTRRSGSQTQKILTRPTLLDSIHTVPHRNSEETTVIQQCSSEIASETTVLHLLLTVWPQLDRRNRVFLIGGLLATVVHAAIPPVFSYMLVQLFQTFYVEEDYAKRSLTYSMTLLAIATVDGLVNFTMHYLLEIAGQKWVDTLKVEAMRRVLQQEKSFFDFAQNSSTNITSTLDNSAEEMRNLVGRFVAPIVNVAAMMAIAIIWSTIVCWKLTLVGIGGVPLLYLATKCFETASARWEFRTNNAGREIGAIFLETFSDMRTVRAFTLESYFHKKCTLATSLCFSIGLRKALFCGFFFGFSDSAINFITATIFWVGAFLASHHSFSVTSILTVFSLLLFSTANANAVVAYIPQISSSVDAGARLLRLSQLPLRSHEFHGKERLDPSDPRTLSGPIHFVNLTFFYPTRPDVPALRRVNFSIPAGECTAIVGSSGSGKSSIASLILGLYPPTADVDGDTPADPSTCPASLIVSGRDIRTLHLPSFRRMVAVVPQTPVLFPGTVRENIVYGLDLNSELTTDCRVIEAARRAGVHDFVLSLPSGYDTVVGEGGLGVSGGQAQRIVIARALVRRPRILILDEATSALDHGNAKIVKQTILGLVRDAKGRNDGVGGGKTKPALTVIVITHSREMMEWADHVVVMAQGHVAEEGRFDDLLRGKGCLWAMLSTRSTAEAQESA